jgi:uncharacterized protein YndB with AHSA1/START domain
MHSPCIVHEDDRARVNSANRRVATNPQEVDFAVEIRGDAMRLFVALTEPEFIETWITLPGTSGMNRIISREGADVRFDLFDRGSSTQGMVWKSVVCRRRKIVFSCIRSFESGRSETVVDIRLRGNFGSTLIDLNHRCIGGPEERDWYRELWTRSLSRLSSLMKFPGVSSWPAPGCCPANVTRPANGNHGNREKARSDFVFGWDEQRSR